MKRLLPATGQIMGFTLETGIFCLVPDGEIPVGYCFDRCCFIFCTSPPGYEWGDEESADRRRGLLKKVCSQERAVGSIAEWSDSTSVRKPTMRIWMSLSFLSSNSACYWDPEVTFLIARSYYPQCSYWGKYTAFVAKSTTPCDCPCDDLVEVKTPPMSVMALAYIAQALVVTIVGLNMGFRYVRHIMCAVKFSIARGVY